MVRWRRCDDRGVTLLEVAIGSAVAMIALALVATVLTTAQRSQRTLTLVSESIDAARIALTDTSNEVRRAQWLTASGPDAIIWLDSNIDRVQQASEVITYRIVTVSGVKQFERSSTTGTRLLASGITTGSLTVVQGAAGATLIVDLAFPSVDGRATTQLRTEVASRGNG